MIFSLFHALTFTRTTLMAQFLKPAPPATAGGPPQPHHLAKKLHAWVKGQYSISTARPFDVFYLPFSSELWYRNEICRTCRTSYFRARLAWSSHVPELALVTYHLRSFLTPALLSISVQSWGGGEGFYTCRTVCAQARKSTCRGYNMGEGSDVGSALGWGYVGTECWSPSVKRLYFCSWILNLSLAR
jgi:hypothetical protein